MRFNPHPYQTKAIQWVIDKPHCALFLSCGLGKSIVTLTAIQRLIDYAEAKTALIVAPKKVAESTWTDEVAKWDHLSDLRVSKIMGTPKQRIAALSTDADIYVLGRDSFTWLVDYYKGVLPYDILVIDELTSFKSPKSGRFKAMKIASTSVDRVIGLTGTPAPNGLIDLWAQMYCIDRGERLGRSVTRYRTTYFDIREWNHIVIKCVPKPGCEAIIRERISDICLTMQAEDYLQLPDLIEHTEYVNLSDAVLKRYKDFEREKVMKLRESVETTSLVDTAAPSSTEAVIANSAAGLMNKLSQFANGAVYGEDCEVIHIHDEKLERLRELVESSLVEEGGVIVFYQYRHDIPRITEALKEYKVVTYDGEKQLRAWNDGKIQVLLAHPASTAYGLNMQQGGHTIIWYGTGWNLEYYQQANARLHRQGQSRPVVVYRLVDRGTVDERMVKAIDGKVNTQKALLDGLKALMEEYRV